MKSIPLLIAEELSVRPQQVEATIQLLDEGARVPFIARYRKEATGGLDDTQLRQLEERLIYLRELDERRQTILKSIQEQEKLTPELQTAIESAQTKQTLEDIYLPYRPKRRTKGQAAIEAGLLPLADALLNDPQQDPATLASTYINAEQGFEDVKQVLEGAKFILMERFCEHSELVVALRDKLRQQAILFATAPEDKRDPQSKFKDYFDYQEAFHKIPAHRALALFRGRKEGILRLQVELPNLETTIPHPCENMIAHYHAIHFDQRPADAWLMEVVRWTWKVKLSTQIENELFSELKEMAEKEAIQVFATNLNNLLMAAPAGNKVILGLDPGFRTGVKATIVDSTGQLLHYTTIFPHAPKNEWDASRELLAQLTQQYSVNLISIGNGTASRETDRLVADMLKTHPEITAKKIVVSEAGASVYSASALAAAEFPTLDVTYRGAVSIARRLQDPLAELVKIEPKAIGVGQYQHDVNQSHLARSLNNVVEDCVNAVGVDVNTASSALLSHVAGLNSTIATHIVNYRNQQGAFSSRQQLTQIPRLGQRTFEQAAGFLRIPNSENPLDASSVHPESYSVVEAIARHYQVDVRQLMQNAELLHQVDPKLFVTEQVGLPTLMDILKELEKPGRDPRPDFVMPHFKDEVTGLNDLTIGMVLEGVITNVTNFGAFVDVGVHQDGLVHISALSHTFVKNPHDVVKTGQIVKVKVMELDIPRKRIGLSMNLETAPAPAEAKTTHRQVQQPKNNKPRPRSEPAAQPKKSGTFANLFAQAKPLRKS